MNGIGVNTDPIDVPANAFLNLSRKIVRSIVSLLALNALSSTSVSSTVTFVINWSVFLIRSSSDIGIRAMHCNSPPKPLNCDSAFDGARASEAAITSVVTTPMKMNKCNWSRFHRMMMCGSMFSLYSTAQTRTNNSISNRIIHKRNEFNLIYCFVTNHVRTNGRHCGVWNTVEQREHSCKRLRRICVKCASHNKIISTEKWF